MKLENFFLLSFLAIICISCTRQKPLKIIPLKQFDVTDSLMGKDGKKVFNKLEHFIIENYLANEKNEKILDSFNNIPLDSSRKKMQNFQRIFYKFSDRTNLKELKENSRDLVRYSQDNDLIYIFYYSKGKFLFKQKWYKGTVLSVKKDIKVSIN